MLSRALCLARSRSLLGYVQHPIPAAQCGIKVYSARQIPSVAVSPFSSSSTLHDTPNNPGKSGDKGPGKNYRKKMRKKRNKATASAAESDALLEGMKAIQSLKSGNKQKKTVGHSTEPRLDAMLEGAKRTIESAMKPQADQVVKQEKKPVERQAPASMLEAIAEGTKVMESLLDQPKAREQREEEMKHTIAPDALTDGAKAIELGVTTQDETVKTMSQGKKQVLWEEKNAPASILEAITEGAKMMETRLDQAKATKRKKKEGERAAMLDALVEGEKMIGSLVASEGQFVPGGTSSVKGRQRPRDVMGGRRARKEQRGVDDYEYPDDMQRFRDSGSRLRTTSSGGFLRRRRDMRAMDDRGAPRPRGDGREYDFTKPSERLGLFHCPKPGNEAMHPHPKPTLAEQDELNRLREFFLLKPTTHFEEQMEGAMTTTVRYPRTFPIDNDDYFKNHEEASIGFEEHVLLDHLLEGFPKRGPVRHFMELVVTGLSKNPHYTAAEKRQCVEWYRDYFSEFTPTELQSL